MAFKFNPFTGTLDIDEGVSDGDKGDITVSGDTWTIDANAVDFSKMQDIAAYKLIGKHTSGSGDPEQVGIDGGLEFQGANIQRSALTGDVTASAGSNSTTIPATTISGKTLLTPLVGTEEVLINDSGVLKKTTSQDIANLSGGGGGGSGDVVGPASATDNAIARFDSTTGKLIQNSTVTISDTGQITAAGSGSGSTIFGTSTVATGLASAAICDNASATANYAFALGVTATSSAQQGTALGWGSHVDGVRGIKIGSGYAGADDLMFGNYTRAAAAGLTFGCCIGSSNVAMTVTATAVTLLNTRRASGAQYSLGLGYLCEPSGFASTSIGYSTVTTGSYSVGIGYDSTISASQDGYGLGRSVVIAHNYSIGLGAGATSTATNQFIVGGQSGPITAFYLGSGVTGATTNNVLFGITGRSGTNLTGRDLTIQSGMGTGTGASGSTLIKIGLAGSSGTTANSPITALQVSSDGVIANPTFSTELDFRIQGAYGYTMSYWNAGTGDITHYMDGIYHVDTSSQPMLQLLYNYRVVQAAASSAPSDGDIFTNGIMFYLDESGNNLKCRVRYSSGTLKTATIALT